MSAFVPGQRVRIVRDIHGNAVPAEVVGAEGVIASPYGLFLATMHGPMHAYEVRLLSSRFAGALVLCQACELEPAIPPQMESREEIDALIQPEPMPHEAAPSFLSTLAEAACIADRGGVW